ncbi:hypothetical protein [Homoserinibacter sp. GY 40078]|uniref:hypothetical protein n=1 Tax=Homoserinibacter sp. GY 40078 TaxID=2603275 RepID=UPI0011C6EC0E|nr:hypothetical protein [Homoserinibacter sp. GY 40078]TXK16306.1 hypothetical protein FVQ89_13700 [Homoserinibacter sp. GY 40078]
MRSRPRPPLFWLLVSLLAVELAAVSIVTIVLVIDLVTLEPTSLATALALTALVLLAAAWMAVTVVGLLRGQAWVRASAIVWQVLQFAIGLGALQGTFAQPAWGWPIVIVSVLTFAVLFAPSVVRATQARAAGD